VDLHDRIRIAPLGQFGTRNSYRGVVLIGIISEPYPG
jgi:hypothetical protein